MVPAAPFLVLMEPLPVLMETDEDEDEEQPPTGGAPMHRDNAEAGVHTPTNPIAYPSNVPLIVIMPAENSNSAPDPDTNVADNSEPQSTVYPPSPDNLWEQAQATSAASATTTHLLLRLVQDLPPMSSTVDNAWKRVFVEQQFALCSRHSVEMDLVRREVEVLRVECEDLRMQRDEAAGERNEARLQLDARTGHEGTAAKIGRLTREGDVFGLLALVVEVWLELVGLVVRWLGRVFVRS